MIQEAMRCWPHAKAKPEEDRNRQMRRPNSRLRKPRQLAREETQAKRNRWLLFDKIEHRPQSQALQRFIVRAEGGGGARAREPVERDPGEDCVNTVSIEREQEMSRARSQTLYFEGLSQCMNNAHFHHLSTDTHRSKTTASQ